MAEAARFPEPITEAKGPTKLVAASGRGDITEVRNILKKYPDKVNITHGGFTALHKASYYGKIEIVKYLTSHDANIDFPDAQKRTALHYAVEGNQPNVVKHLLEMKASSQLTDVDGKTPLQIAKELRYGGCISPFRVNEFNFEKKVLPDTKPKVLCAANLGVKHALRNNGCIGGCGVKECVTFNPCGHRILCFECTGKQQKCQQCLGNIETVSYNPRCENIRKIINEIGGLRKENEKLKTETRCVLCNERKNDCLIEKCCHVFCSDCVDKLMEKDRSSCPNCRKLITGRKKIYL